MAVCNDRSHIVALGSAAFLSPLTANIILLQAGTYSATSYLLWQIILSISSIIVATRLVKESLILSVMTRAWLLGFGCSIGAHLVMLPLSYLAPLGLYLAAFCLFHFTEFVAIGLRNPNSVSAQSFLFGLSDCDQDRPKLNSKSFVGKWIMPNMWPGCELHLGLVMSVVEYTLNFKSLFAKFPDQFLAWAPIVGFGLCLLGELIRKTAMLTAGKSFNHVVQKEKSRDHLLVTSGIYSFCRHPSYVGFLVWLAGTQIILMNPISLCLFVSLAWLIISRRIVREEEPLVEFFGPSYLKYRARVPSGIPFVK